jgi:hypothetical protein
MVKGLATEYVPKILRRSWGYSITYAHLPRGSKAWRVFDKRMTFTPPFHCGPVRYVTFREGLRTMKFNLSGAGFLSLLLPMASALTPDVFPPPQRRRVTIKCLELKEGAVGISYGRGWQPGYASLSAA